MQHEYIQSPATRWVMYGTDLRAYLALIEAAHPCRQTELVLLGPGPLTAQIDNWYGNEPDQDDATDDDSNYDTDLLPLTAHIIHTLHSCYSVSTQHLMGSFC